MHCLSMASAMGRRSYHTLFLGRDLVVTASSAIIPRLVAFSCKMIFLRHGRD
jgi:hypothetical protein